MTIYTDLVQAGCKIDNHESDLYVEDTPQAREIVAKHGMRPGFFKSDGEQWMELPFMYEPHWFR